MHVTNKFSPLIILEVSIEHKQTHLFCRRLFDGFNKSQVDLEKIKESVIEQVRRRKRKETIIFFPRKSRIGRKKKESGEVI